MVRNTWILLPFLILGTPVFAKDGGGFNGPDDSTVIIPEAPDWGIPFREVDQATLRCFVPQFEKLAFAITGVTPTALPRSVCSVVSQRQRSPDVPHGLNGLVNWKCILPATATTPEIQIESEFSKLRLGVPDHLKPGGIISSRLQTADEFPEIHFSSQVLHRRLGQEDEVVELARSLEFGTGLDFESEGQAIGFVKLHDYDDVWKRLPEGFALWINGRDFVDCVQSEIQKTPATPVDHGREFPAPQCPELEPWYQERAQGLLNASTVAARSRAKIREWEVRRDLVRGLYAQYEKGQLDMNRFEACLASDPLKSDFLQTLYSEFYEATLARLRAAKSPGIRRFVDLTDRKYRLNHKRPLFRLTGHFDQESSGSLFAGVHRASGSIYMDLAKIPRDQWYIIFIHEMAHKLDQDLAEAVTEYALSLGLMTELEDWARKSTLADLPAEVREDLETWLISGLNRGLWAEFRAWYVTFRLYQEGVTEGLWQPIARFDEVLASKPSESSFAKHLYAFLESRAQMPAAGPYSSPLMREAIESLLTSTRTSEAHAPSLGSLGNLWSE